MLESLSALLSRKHDAPHPTVISLGQVWVDIMMDIDSIPQPGGFAVADHTSPSVGGSFRVMQAASRIGATTKHAGIIGNGPWASIIRNACEADGIEHIGQDRIDADCGFRLVLNDGERKTFIATYGAEAQGDETTFDCVEPREGDVVHVSGNTLMDHSASGIDAFVDRAASDPTQRAYRIVLNPTNTLHMVSDQLLEDLVLAHPIWSCNRQEARTLAERLGVDMDDTMSMTVGGGFDASMKSLCSRLGAALRAPLVVRAGSRGAWVRTPGEDVEHVEGYPTKAKHTRSAGSCHTGAMCALLALGWSLRDAVQIANAAASLAIQRSVNGVPDCPGFDEAIALVERTEDAARRSTV